MCLIISVIFGLFGKANGNHVLDFTGTNGSLLWTVCTLLLTTSASAETFSNLSETCPEVFEVVDLGVVDIDSDGRVFLAPGGLLLSIGRQDKSESYVENKSVFCVDNSDGTDLRQYRDGLPIPVVSSVTITPSIEPSVSARVSLVGSAQEAYNLTEGAWSDLFGKWQERTEYQENGGVFVGEKHTCLYDPNNPELTGYGNYACLATIDGMPHSPTFFRCNRWGGCELEFSLENGLRFSLTLSSLPNQPEAGEARNPTEAVEFWSNYALSFRGAFLDSIIPRDEQIIYEVE